MGLRAQKYVMANRELTRGARLLLICIAHYADDFGLAFPGQETLAKATNMRIETVNRYLKRLEFLGYITMLVSVKNHRRRGYQLHFEVIASGVDVPSPKGGRVASPESDDWVPLASSKLDREIIPSPLGKPDPGVKRARAGSTENVTLKTRKGDLSPAKHLTRRSLQSKTIQRYESYDDDLARGDEREIALRKQRWGEMRPKLKVDHQDHWCSGLSALAQRSDGHLQAHRAAAEFAAFLVGHSLKAAGFDKIYIDTFSDWIEL